jgi:sugar phosphate isomerase/epimerase
MEFVLMFKNLNPSFLGINGHQSELIELALSFGFGGIDISAVEFATRVKLKGLDYARRLIASSRLQVGTFELPVNCEADDATYAKQLAKLAEYAQAVAATGCTRCVATLAPASETRPYHENFELHRRRLQEICNVLQPLGVRLGLGFYAAENLRANKPLQFIHDLDALLLLVNMVGAPNVGVLLDIWEVFACGGSLESVRKIPAGQIVAVQVADMPADAALNTVDDTARSLPGTEGGRIDLPALLTLLKQAGYEGPVTPKPSRAILQTRRRDMVVRQVGEALDKVWRAAGLVSERKFVASAAAQDYRGDYNSY